jgi:hypothetical protein
MSLGMSKDKLRVIIQITFLVLGISFPIMAKPIFLAGVQPRFTFAEDKPFDRGQCLSIGIGLHGGLDWENGLVTVLGRANIESSNLLPGGIDPSEIPPLYDGTYIMRFYDGLYYWDNHFIIEGEVRSNPCWWIIAHGSMGRVIRKAEHDYTTGAIGIGFIWKYRNFNFLIKGGNRFYHFPYDLERRTYEDGSLIEREELGRFHQWHRAIAISFCMERRFGG